MIGLDTNVIVRFLAQDDPAQAARANALFDGLSEDDPGFVSIVAMVETVWVLDRAYGLGAAGIAAAVEGLLAADTLVIEDEQAVFTAMIALKEDRGSFADALIAGLGAKAGCSHTATFDRRARRLPGFAPVP